MQPMLASRGDHVVTSDEWVHEVKWDGMRVIAEVSLGLGGRPSVRLLSRNENDVTASFPELSGLTKLGHDVVLDGEVVVMHQGRPSFHALSRRLRVSGAKARVGSHPVDFVVFDLLRLDGHDLTGFELHERRALLENLDPRGAFLVSPLHSDRDALMASVVEQGLEGIVSKKRTSRYQPGTRSNDWLKFPLRDTASFVIGGYRQENDNSGRLGALLLGRPVPGGLDFVGRVGAGLAGKAGEKVLETLESVETSPFTADLPGADAEGAVWVKPELIVDVEYLEESHDGRLRQPTFRGVRSDLDTGDLDRGDLDRGDLDWGDLGVGDIGSASTTDTSGRSAANSPPTNAEPTRTWVRVDGRKLSLTNLTKVLYPRTGTTKADVLQYYAEIAPVVLPHLAGRAVTRIRWPHGIDGPSFFEKNAPGGTPSWVRTVTVPTTGSRGDGEAGELRFPIIDSVASLTWLANLAALELHVHQWLVDEAGDPVNPDRLVVDLDPGEQAGLGECSQVALWVRDRLAEDGLDAVPVTSGSKGIHIYAGLAGDLNSSEVRDYVREIGEELAKKHQHLVVTEMTKAKRTGKVFLDWSQNSGAKTTISPYSLRGRDFPFVAAPRAWEEVEEGAEDPLALEQLTMSQVLQRVSAEGDLFDA